MFKELGKRHTLYSPLRYSQSIFTEEALRNPLLPRNSFNILIFQATHLGDMAMAKFCLHPSRSTLSRLCSRSEHCLGTCYRHFPGKHDADTRDCYSGHVNNTDVKSILKTYLLSAYQASSSRDTIARNKVPIFWPNSWDGLICTPTIPILICIKTSSMLQGAG